MRALCLIPARGGSKGLREKNLRLAGGISLVGRAVLAAREFARQVNMAGTRVLVDTDSEVIAEESRRWGGAVPFLRPQELAADDTPTILSTLKVLERLEGQGASFDAIILLQPTSPLRTAGDILACWRAYDPPQVPSVISVTPTEHRAALALLLDADGRVAWNDARGAALPRQQLPETWWPSGAVYIAAPEFLRQEGAFIVPGRTAGVPIPAARSVDIDTAEDLARAEALLATEPVAPFPIPGRVIGPGQPCYVIAEAGVNHNGDPALAKQLIDAAAAAAVDAVKFQTFDPDLLVAAGTPKAEYQIASTGGEESQRDMLRRLTLPQETFAALARYAESKGILFLSTPFEERSADFLEWIGMGAFKVSSGEVTNHPLLAHIARKGKPLLLSTGMSDLAEVAEAVGVIRSNGNPPLALLHCVTNYPAAPADCNLRAMETLRRAFGVPVGWSDHTMGLTLSLAAAAAGADVIEKHFTIDRGLPGPDHRASLEPAELTALVVALRQLEAARGDGVKRPMPGEAANARLVRRSLHAARPLPVGHILGVDDLLALRPGTGLPPSLRDRLVGRRVVRALAAGEMLREDHVA